MSRTFPLGATALHVGCTSVCQFRSNIYILDKTTNVSLWQVTVPLWLQSTSNMSTQIIVQTMLLIIPELHNFHSTSYGLDVRVFVVRFPAKVILFSLFQSAQAGSDLPSLLFNRTVEAPYWSLTSIWYQGQEWVALNHHCRNTLSWRPLQSGKTHEYLVHRFSAFSQSRRILKKILFLAYITYVTLRRKTLQYNTETAEVV